MPDQADPIRSILHAHPTGPIHLMGIGGFGMAGLAGLLHARGYCVSGCDLNENRMTQRLQKEGIPAAIGHTPDHLAPRHPVPGASGDTAHPAPVMLVRSSAVPEQQAELVAARQRGIPVYRRGELFPALLRDEYTVAISGTHGKTTTTALCAHAVRSVAAAAPTFFIGGEWEEDGRVFERGDYPVTLVEADESDGTLQHYQPDIALITGVDYDHMEHFTDERSFMNVFETFIRQARETVIGCGDDDRLLRLLPDPSETWLYGLSPAAQMRATEIVARAGHTEFTVVCDGSDLGRYTLPIPGTYNIINALGALSVVRQLGLSVTRAAEGLASFQPVRRRFEQVGQWKGVPVYSDYAHHPTEIRALMVAVHRHVPGRLLVIFQPHRYTRTRALGTEFPAAFKGADSVILAPVYAASEQPIDGGRIDDLAKHFADYGTIPFTQANDLDHAWTLFDQMAREGDTLFLIGAGDIEQLANAVEPV